MRQSQKSQERRVLQMRQNRKSLKQGALIVEEPKLTEAEEGCFKAQVLRSTIESQRGPHSR